MPLTGFLLLVLGILLVYCEFIWIGKLFFGVAGAMCFLKGLSLLLALPHSWLGLLLLGASVLLFVLDAFTDTLFVASMCATILMASGFWQLCLPPHEIKPRFAVSVSVVLGLATAALLSITRKARRNKRLDL